MLATEALRRHVMSAGKRPGLDVQIVATSELGDLGVVDGQRLAVDRSPELVHVPALAERDLDVGRVAKYGAELNCPSTKPG
jgi:hypothetical protein